MALLGYDMFGLEVFSDDSPSIQSVKYAEFSDSIIDEISIREKTNQGMDNVRDTWQNDSIFIAKMLNSLEAGNISGEGVKIVKFQILRRESVQSETEDLFLGEVSFDNTATNVDLSFEDVTNPNTSLIYTILPVGENGISGSPREVSVESDFTGVWIVDKDTGNVLVFDSAIGSIGNVESTVNQNRTQIDTFSQFPQFYYGLQSFESFTLSTVILPEEGEKSNKKYKDILNKFILDHKPKIVKTDTGKILVADISNLRASTPLNTWSGYDYSTITVDVTEVADYEKFMKGE